MLKVCKKGMAASVNTSQQHCAQYFLNAKPENFSVNILSGLTISQHSNPIMVYSIQGCCIFIPQPNGL